MNIKIVFDRYQFDEAYRCGQLNINPNEKWEDFQTRQAADGEARIQKAVDLLNGLTAEQAEAVKFFGECRYTEGTDNERCSHEE